MNTGDGTVIDGWLADSSQGCGAEVFGTIGIECSEDDLAITRLEKKYGRWIAPWIITWIKQATNCSYEDIFNMDDDTLNKYAENAKVLLNPKNGN